MAATSPPASERSAPRTLAEIRPALRRRWWIALLLWLLLGGNAVHLVWTLPVWAVPATSWVATPLAIAATVLPIAWAGLAIGGRRGIAAAVVLVGLATYWAWWFGWQVDLAGGGISPWRVAEGLGAAADWHLRLAWNLLPVVVAVLIAVALAARWRKRSASSAMALAVMVLVVLAVPRGAAWNDGCNAMSGSAPAITGSAATTLMDHGIGVMPIDWSTLALCTDVGDRTWRPVWQGDDGLPVSRER